MFALFASSIAIGAEAGFAVGGPPGAVVGAVAGLAILGIAALIVYNSKADEVPDTTDKPTKECPVKETDKKIDEVLEGSTPGKESSSKQVSKPGGMSQAEKDFDKLVGNGKTTTYPNGTKVGELPDGTKVNVRPQSSEGRPTLEIQQRPGGGKPIKIRYD